MLGVMSDPIDAIYEGGVLKPLVPLVLPDKARVTITVDAEPQTIVSASTPSGSAIKPLDDWERQLLGIARDCGVSLTDAAVGSEGLYE